MIPPSATKHIKQSQKESLYLKEIVQLLREAALDEPQLNDAFVSRVELSSDCGVCYVFFYTDRGEEYFETVLKVLKLYKPSLRKALAHRVAGRYTPELIFKFDDLFEKQQRLENLFEKIKTEQ